MPASRFDNWPLDELLIEAARFGHVELKRIQYVGTPRSQDRWQMEIRLPTHLGENIPRNFRTEGEDPRMAVLRAVAEAHAWAASPQRAIDRQRYLDSVERHKAVALMERRAFVEKYHGVHPDIDVDEAP